MAKFVDAQRDADDLAKLVNEDAEVTTRYGDNPKRSWKFLEGEFDALLAGFTVQGDAAINAINDDVVTVDNARIAAQSSINTDISAVDSYRVSAQSAINSDVVVVDNAKDAALTSIESDKVIVQQAADSVDVLIDELTSNYNLTPAFDFVDGFTIQTRNQAGKDADGNYWVYSGALPFLVTAGTVPSSPNYKQVTFNSSDNISTVDGNLTESLKIRATDEVLWGDRFVGYFVDGFVYTSDGDIAKGGDGNYYKYAGSSSYPVVVNAGTTPSEPDYKQVTFNLIDDLSVPYIFDTVADFKSSLIEFPDGKIIHLKDREADFIKVTGAGLNNDLDSIKSTSVDQSLSLIYSDTLDIKALGATGFVDSFALSSDASLALNRAAEISVEGNGSIKIVSPFNVAIKAAIDLRFASFDLSNIDIVVGNDIVPAIHMGDRANGGVSARQLMGFAYRDGESLSAPDETKPIIRVTGAKGQSIYIKACPFVQLYADTNSAVNDNDSSCAYSHFSGETIRLLELTTAPTTDGSLTQWINENEIRFARVDKLKVNGTYNHNHNIFRGGTYEGEAVIELDKGNSNIMEYIRFEKYAGLDAPKVVYGSGTWANAIVQSWYSDWRRVFENRDIDLDLQDSGRGNMVVRTADYMLRNVDLFAVSRGSVTVVSNSATSRTSVNGFYAIPFDADTYSVPTAFGLIYKSTYIKCASGCGFNIEMPTGSNVRIRWRAFDANFAAVNIVNNVNIGLDGSTTNVTGNLATQNANVNGSIIGILDSSIEYITIEILAGSGGSNFDYLNIKGVISYAEPRFWGERCLMDFCNPTSDGVPQACYAPKGTQVIDGATGTAYRCTSSLDTYAKATAQGATTINSDSVSGIGNTDVIGIKLASGTHWTTATGTLTSTSFTIADPLPEALAGGERITSCRWV